MDKRAEKKERAAVTGGPPCCEEGYGKGGVLVGADGYGGGAGAGLGLAVPTVTTTGLRAEWRGEPEWSR